MRVFIIGALLIGFFGIIALVQKITPEGETILNTGVVQPALGEPTMQNQSTVYVDGLLVPVEIVATPQARSQGLSGRKSLLPGTGMLFVFEERGDYQFWMPNMNFSIDIVWIKDGGIVGITENVSPQSYPQTFGPPEPVRYVLEVNAGFAKENDWKVGDSVEISINER